MERTGEVDGSVNVCHPFLSYTSMAFLRDLIFVSQCGHHVDIIRKWKSNPSTDSRKEHKLEQFKCGLEIQKTNREFEDQTAKVLAEGPLIDQKEEVCKGLNE